MTLGYHALTDEWVITPWQCDYPNALTAAEAANVLDTHGKHGPECRIARTARMVLARLIDAPTVRAIAYAEAR